MQRDPDSLSCAAAWFPVPSIRLKLLLLTTRTVTRWTPLPDPLLIAGPAKTALILQSHLSALSPLQSTYREFSNKSTVLILIASGLPPHIMHTPMTPHRPIAPSFPTAVLSFPSFLRYPRYPSSSLVPSLLESLRAFPFPPAHSLAWFHVISLRPPPPSLGNIYTIRPPRLSNAGLTLFFPLP